MGLKEEAIALRQQGKSYGEIQIVLDTKIPKSTLSYWCKNYSFTHLQLNRIEKRISAGGEKGRAAALAAKRARREQYRENLRIKNRDLVQVLFRDLMTAKTGLVILYLAEGAKNRKGSLMFGNSNPNIILMFLKLLHLVYDIDESKFRCTVQCRADQDVKTLERHWSRITSIPLSQFYKTRVDARTIGKTSRKKDYKGVCRLEYFSADVYHDLSVAGNVLSGTM